MRIPSASTILTVEGEKFLATEEQDFDEKNYRVVRICPAISERCFHSNNIENVMDAVHERKLKPDRKFTLPAAQRKEVRETTYALMNRYLTKSDIENMIKWLIETDYVSKKWSEKRYEAAAQNGRSRHIPGKGIQHSSGIKLEPHKPGKPPRLLVADGDLGQIAAILTVGILEKRIFTVYEDESIKGLPKDEAIDRAIERTQLHTPNPVCVMEADGSAFDMSVCLEVREMVENPPLDRIQQVLEEHLVCGLISEAEADRNTRRKPKFEIRVVPRDHNAPTEELMLAFAKKSIKVEIDSIRKSGQRGTSSLNWLTSKVLGAWVIFGTNAPHMMDKQATGAKDIFGVHRKYLPVYEGDDQMASVSPPFTPAEVVVLQERWAQMSFGMKIEIRHKGSQVEFTGWKMLVGDHGPIPGSAVPDIPRQLSNVPYCLSATASAAAKMGDSETLGQIASASLIVCAHSIALKAPSLAAVLLHWSEQWSDKQLFSHDQLMKLCPEAYELVVPEHWKEYDKVAKKQLVSSCRDKSTIREATVRRITSAWSANKDGMDTEAQFAVSHNWCASVEEWTNFLTGLEAVGVESDDAAIRSIAPPKLRSIVI